MEEVVLQHFMMPSGIVRGTELLYCRTEHDSFPVHLLKDESLDLRSHFNLIPIGVLKKYGIDEITIEVDIQGEAEISLFIDDSETPISKNKITDAISFKIENGNLLGVIITSLSDCTITGGRVIISSNDLKKIRLALVICTYRREAVVSSKISSVMSFIVENNLDDIVDMIVVDNGSTLDISGVKLIQSKNYGGSAGFSRGMIEAVNDGCTHIVLNDDDALLEPEILFRTISLLSIIGDDAIIGGSMISLEDPSIVYESGAICNGSELYSNCRNVDISNIGGNLEIAKDKMIDYTGWWYSVFPASLVRMIGYPLPFFFKEDDVEYGLRSNTEKIMVCGISVWHPVPKYDPSVNYYYVRNHLITVASHGLLDRKMIKSFISKILLEISAYRYDGADMMMMGLKDFIKGPELVYEKCKSGVVSRKIEYRSLYDLREDDDYSSEPPGQGFLFRLMTMNGLFLPSVGNTEKDARDMETKDFYRMKKILYRVDEERGFIAKIDRRRTIKLSVMAVWLFLSLSFKKKRLFKKYHNSLSQYISEDNWNKILDVE